MKDLTRFIVGSFLFIVCVSSTYAQVLFTNIKCTARWVPEPNIQASSNVSRGTNANIRWLQFDVDYNTVAGKTKSGWLDNVTIKYDVLLPKTGPRSVVLSGQVTYWSIKMDGEEHHAQAFIHPRILQRYSPGLRMKKSELKDLRILITILVNDAPVGMGVYKMKSNTDPRAVKSDVDKALRNVSTFKGKDLVFGRDLTPWGVLNTSYYELIKRKK